MKKIYILFSSIIFILALVSCEADKDPVYDVNTMNPTPSKFLAPDPGSDYTFVEEIANNTFDVFQWTPTDYGIPVGRKYRLEIDLFDRNFEKAVVLTTTDQTEARFKVDEINMAINKLMVVSKTNPTSVKLKLRIVTMAYGGEKSDVLLTQFPTVYSEPIEMVIKPYWVEVIPDKMYMMGDEFGNLDWGNPGVVEMTPVNSLPGFFFTIQYFTAGKRFTFSADYPDNKIFNKLATNTGFTAGTEYSEVTTSGLYIVYMDFVGQTIIMETPQIFGTGDCFGSWGDELNPFTIDNATGKATVKVKNTDKLRIYTKAPVGTVDWWKMEFIILNGKITYRGNGGEQTSVMATANQTVTLDFKTGTGTIQ